MTHALPFRPCIRRPKTWKTWCAALGLPREIARQYGRPLPIAAKMTRRALSLLGVADPVGPRLGCASCRLAPTAATVWGVPWLFWWEGPDGSRILCNYTPSYGSDLTPPPGWAAKNYLALIMTGDNQGTAFAGGRRQSAARGQEGFAGRPRPLRHLGRFRSLRCLAEKPDLPVVRADMPDMWIHGWMSMPIESKAAHAIRPV